MSDIVGPESYVVKTTDVYGMAQRGYSVINLVCLDDKVFSPMVNGQ